MLRWVAAASLNASSDLGGYITTPDRLEFPNDRPEKWAPYAPKEYAYNGSALPQVDPYANQGTNTSVFTGLIGAQSNYSGSRGTVEQFATAAEAGGLSFVVFLEPFVKLSNHSFAQLKTECARLSTPTLTLLAGFTIDSNIGDHMYFYGPLAELPVPDVLDGNTLNVQPRDAAGNFTGRNDQHSFAFMIKPVMTSVDTWTSGYFHLSSPTATLHAYDLRAYSQLAVRYYEDGQLVEDNSEGYLRTAESTVRAIPSLHCYRKFSCAAAL
jgi:hypothetical protein